MQSFLQSAQLSVPGPPFLWVWWCIVRMPAELFLCRLTTHRPSHPVVSSTTRGQSCTVTRPSPREVVTCAAVAPLVASSSRVSSTSATALGHEWELTVHVQGREMLHVLKICSSSKTFSTSGPLLCIRGFMSSRSGVDGSETKKLMASDDDVGFTFGALTTPLSYSHSPFSIPYWY